MPTEGREGDRVFVKRLFVRNYKSVGKANLELGPLTALVGRNGAGKSNLLDALRFVVDALQASLDHAVKARGGIDEVRRRSTGHPRNFGLELELVLPSFHQAAYGFEIAARAKGTFVVKVERLEIHDHRGDRVASFLREEGRVVSASVSNPPPVLPDRLYLVNAAGLPDYRPVFDALVAMGFYNLEPRAMKELQNPDAGELLRGNGSNIASVVARLSSEEPQALARIEHYLGTIVEGIDRFERVGLGPKETLQLWQRVKGSKHPWRFFASSVSDGTLRALGALVAVSQLVDQRHPASLVGIEEPETALHPAAAGALMDALREASSRTQVVLTTHSPDFLDHLDFEDDRLLVVVAREGTTCVAPADPASLEAMRRHLFSPGELLRMDQLEPDPAELACQEQMDLFAVAASEP